MTGMRELVDELKHAWAAFSAARAEVHKGGMIENIEAESHARDELETALLENDALPKLLSAIDSLSSQVAELRGGWQPIETAPKDGTHILLLIKDPIPREGRPDLEGFYGLQFVGRCKRYDDGTDGGWNFAAPVGVGGLPDDWMAGWQPLPPALIQKENGG